MDLTPGAIMRAVYPTAVAVPEASPSPNAEGDTTSYKPTWEESQLNPKNRIDSLDPVASPRWRIDGSSGLGTQFYTVPLFIPHMVPMRIDTFIPNWSDYPLELRRLLDMGSAFHCRDARVARLGISRHILRALEFQTDNSPGFVDRYKELPFGSRIVFGNLAKNIRDIDIDTFRNHDLERQFWSLKDVQASIGAPPLTWPPPIDLASLRFVRQLHDSICLVSISTQTGPRHLVFKALNSSPGYLYRELQNLHCLSPHPNIISSPQHLVTKRCRFGAKRAVIGFTLEYHPPGTLRDILPWRRICGTLKLVDQLRWSIQLTSALIHIQVHGMFYSDLRLDNILLSESGDLVMVDFEQRGLWCTFASPELNYQGYAHMLACNEKVPQDIRARFRSLLDRRVPDWKEWCSPACRDLVSGTPMPWMAPGKEEKEAATVYMLGRVLWCIFEGCSMPERAIWNSCQYEDDLQFPDYSRTPPALRSIIDDCTLGREDWRGQPGQGVVRNGNQLVLRDGDGTETEDAVQAEATRWWQRELTCVEEFLETQRQRTTGDGDSQDPKVYHERPTLCAVLKALEGIACEGHDRH